MTNTAPDAAVQTAVRALGPSMISMENARRVVDALARAGWLCEPEEVERLRAVAEAARIIAGVGALSTAMHDRLLNALAVLDATHREMAR